MKKILLLWVALSSVANASSDISNMSIQEKCSAWKNRSGQIVVEYFSGVTRDEQYSLIDKIAGSGENAALKKMIDSVYDNIPFVQNIDQRNWYEKQYAESVYEMCIDKYVNAKP